MATGGESRDEESRPPGQEPDHVGSCRPVRTVALLCLGKERPGRPWGGFVWDLVPDLTSTWKQSSLAGAKTLLRFRPGALLFCLHPIQ